MSFVRDNYPQLRQFHWDIFQESTGKNLTIHIVILDCYGCVGRAAVGVCVVICAPPVMSHVQIEPPWLASDGSGERERGGVSERLTLSVTMAAPFWKANLRSMCSLTTQIRSGQQPTVSFPCSKGSKGKGETTHGWTSKQPCVLASISHSLSLAPFHQETISELIGDCRCI